ncbi:hypothetical protein G6F57_001756 [Rhizopus arrhizus]|uniref:R3H domain-containing protein n=1 Tax=Rhizopus oryzae TaxID=64495 RepID=A0A9P7BPV6_RHIOR|nr:hypothetical protein G6F23_010840 [Rhizopus arrhizus]KAG0769052.1 hypothetical protein G6F24_001403 [Rhizopus arrhizus]KAG0791342.1 hypothetical protein G6F22_006165 [Rhizopus arrhizus]KAG0795835.1 hypothetical protein G6F21_001788 [Rhizopus arrhizus]KAG0839381.1 hypothetical protein G6F19_002605 [Rhizopus arrhizus]
MSYNNYQYDNNHSQQQTSSHFALNNYNQCDIYYPSILTPALQPFNDPIVPTEPDEFILDLLKKPQERLFLLKLELDIEEFIKDKRRFRLDFPNMNSYQRLMIHKLASYYKLNHFHDGLTRGVYVCKTVITEFPLVRLLDIDMSEKTEGREQPNSSSMPQFKIMRRSTGPGSTSSRSSSSAGEDKSKNGTADRKNMTLEERQTAYEKARARIFQDLEKKQQQQ